jgi:GNAT superfamily N-acetyltransferase
MEAARPPLPEELERVAELHRLAVDTARPERGGAVFAARETGGEPLIEWLRARLDEGGLWAGTVADAIVGYAVAASEVLRDGTRLGRLEAIFVEQEARGVGVGASLMDEVLRWADDQGCDGVDAWALPGDRHTKNFFEGTGFSARLLVMHHRMKPVNPSEDAEQ